jgi:hypothetical protein
MGALRALAEYQRRPMCRPRDSFVQQSGLPPDMVHLLTPGHAGVPPAATSASKVGSRAQFPAPSPGGKAPQVLFTVDDMFDALTTIPRPNASARVYQTCAIKLELRTPTLQQLRVAFRELHPTHRHLGVDEVVLGNEWFMDARQELGEHMVSSPMGAHVALWKQYAKFGVPASLRPQVWSRILRVKSSPEHSLYFDSLRRKVSQWDLVHTFKLCEMHSLVILWFSLIRMSIRRSEKPGGVCACVFWWGFFFLLVLCCCVRGQHYQNLSTF